MGDLPTEIATLVLAETPISGLIALASATVQAEKDDVWNSKLAIYGVPRVKCPQGLWFILRSGLLPINQLFVALNNGVASHAEFIWRYYNLSLKPYTRDPSIRVARNLTPEARQALVVMIRKSKLTCNEAVNMFVDVDTLSGSDLVVEACREEYWNEGYAWPLGIEVLARPYVVLFAQKLAELGLEPNSPELCAAYLDVFLVHLSAECHLISYYYRNRVEFSHPRVRVLARSAASKLEMLASNEPEKYRGAWQLAITIGNDK